MCCCSQWGSGRTHDSFCRDRVRAEMQKEYQGDLPLERLEKRIAEVTATKAVAAKLEHLRRVPVEMLCSFPACPVVNAEQQEHREKITVEPPF